ncbi:ribonuclease H-like domain-containing protein [Tanacetum coccineum]|uniref:Ribonuclease H-like domain-containing protein n=1 Tax=Tanacetum coccineum TaxID=301880 RepID=A0ABQ5DR75_9ASTR
MRKQNKDGSKQNKEFTSNAAKKIDDVISQVMGAEFDEGVGSPTLNVAVHHDSPCNEGTKSYANLFNIGSPQASNEVKPNMGGVSNTNKARSDGGVNVSKKQNFKALVNKEMVENANTVLPIVAFTIVQNYVNNTWAKFGLQKLVKNDDGVFLFKFTSKDRLERVLERGPWIIRNTPIILNRWTPNVSLKIDVVTKVPVWIKLYNVPMVAYSKDGLSLLATQGQINFERALVELNVDYVLKNEVSMAIPLEDESGHTQEVIRVEYEWKPPHCSECKIFRHTDENCQKKVKLDTNSDKCPMIVKEPVIVSIVGMNSDGFTEVKRNKNKGKKVVKKPNSNFYWQKKGTKKKGADMDSTTQNMDIGAEYGTSSSRSTHEEDSESGLKSAQWNEDLMSDDEVDEYIFLEGDKFGDKFDIRLKGRVRK